MIDVMQPLFNSAPDTSAMRVRYDQSTSPPARVLIRAISFTPHRLSPGHYLTPQNIPLIYVPRSHGSLSLNTDGDIGEPTEDTTNFRDAIFGFVRPSRKEFRLCLTPTR